MKSIIQKDLEAIWLLFFTIFIMLPAGLFTWFVCGIADWWEKR